MNSKPNEKEIVFEDALKRLEEIVKQLEGGLVPLDKAIEFFEEGISLSDYCCKQLNDAEQRVTVLIKDSGNNIIEEEFKI